MRLFRHYAEIPVEARGAVVALGNFDGVHRGHQAVIGEARRRADAAGAPHAVLTFEPHPREFFQPHQACFRLTPLRIKMRQLEAMGVDYVFVLHFDETLARMSAEAFVVEVLVEGIDLAQVVVGYDFVFGRGRRGNAALLRDLGGLHGFGVTSLEPVRGAAGDAYSSTRIREHLVGARPAAAAELLGRPWEIAGRVEPGARIGRGLGFPTANIGLGEYLQPAQGIYAVRAGIDEGAGTVWRDGVAYIGPRPTFGGTTVRLEAHLFAFSEDLYGRHLRVALIDYLRGDMTFDGIGDLQAQIAADCQRAKAVLAAYRGPAPGAVPPPPASEIAFSDQRSFYERALGPRPDTGT